MTPPVRGHPTGAATLESVAAAPRVRLPSRPFSLIVLLGMVTLLPVWASPVLVTNDGPSHLYNAMLAEAVRAGRSPYADHFGIEDTGFGPNQASRALIALLGGALGWEAAERMVLTLAIAGLYAVVIAVAWPAGRRLAVALAPLAAWLAHNWFAWMGLYDFALSLPVYGLLVLVLAGGPMTPKRHVAVQALLLLLYVTHFFSFVLGAAAVMAALGWAALHQRGRWFALVAVAPAGVLIAAGLASRVAGAGGPAAVRPWQSLGSLALGDIVRIAHAVDTVAGVALVALLVATVLRLGREARRGGIRVLTGPEVFGLAVLGFSVVAPERFGDAWLIPLRLQMLGALALLSAVVATASRLRPSVVLWSGAAGLLVAFLAHTAYQFRDSRIVQRDMLVADRLFSLAGADAGDWVVTKFLTYRRGLYRIAAYRNLAARIATHRDYVVLDNYEALYSYFPVNWRRRPDWVSFRPATGGLTLRLSPGAVGWPGALYVLHDPAQRLFAVDPRLSTGATVAGGGLAVTQVFRHSDPGGVR